MWTRPTVHMPTSASALKLMICTETFNQTGIVQRSADVSAKNYLRISVSILMLFLEQTVATEVS